MISQDIENEVNESWNEELPNQDDPSGDFPEEESELKQNEDSELDEQNVDKTIYQHLHQTEAPKAIEQYSNIDEEEN